MSEISIDYLLAGVPAKAWFTLSEAANLKGLNRKTAYNRRWLQPNGGVPDAMIGGRHMWSRDTVLQWVPKTDAELEADNLASSPSPTTEE